MWKKSIFLKLIAMAAIISMASCETLNINKSDSDIDPKELPKWTISVNEIVRYPRASAGEKEMQTFSGQTIWVRKFYEFNSKVVEKVSLIPTDKPDEFDLRLKLNRQGSLIAMRLCNDKLHPPCGLSVDGLFYSPIKVQKPSDTKPDDYSDIIILAPFSKELAEPIAKYSEANYKHLNKDLKQMLSTVKSAALYGIDAFPVSIEVNATMAGKESFLTIVGLPDNAVKESKDRVKSAIESSGLAYPFGKTVVNLAPADMKKEGASFDLPIALAIMHANNTLKGDKVKKGLILGELALDGSLRSIKGALSIALMASESSDYEYIILPSSNAEEAAIASDSLPVYGISHLREAYDFLSGKKELIPVTVNHSEYFNKEIYPENMPDFSDVKGQIYVKRALEIAAAGAHNILMIGPPGSGKSMLAKRISGILPPLHLQEALEVTRTHSIMGLLPPHTPILKNRPFRSPHHTISDAGMIGGGQTNPNPGEISLAHNGVLFLDEFPEFKRNVLEVLRQPMENGNVTITRTAGSFTYPARFMLVAAMNPCPCGHYGSTQRQCRCSTHEILRYRRKISGPLLDRIDIHIQVSPLNQDELLRAPVETESSADIRLKVSEARKKQLNRLSSRNMFSNSQMDSKELQLFCKIKPDIALFLKNSVNELQLSARAFDKVLKVSRTIADLEKSDEIELHHVCEAVQYRLLDKRLW